jgi:hypothetical protein
VQELVQGGHGLQGNDTHVPGTPRREYGEHPDVGSDIEDARAVGNGEFVAEIRSFNEDLVVQQDRFAPARAVKLKPARQPLSFKKLVGDFKNVGGEWQPQGEPVPVRVHAFIDKELGKALPCGVYDVGLNNAWVSVGVDHDTAEFAVESIARWWRHMGTCWFSPWCGRSLVSISYSTSPTASMSTLEKGQALARRASTIALARDALPVFLSRCSRKQTREWLDGQ